MADVVCAEDLQLGRKVAIKLLHRRFAQDEEFVERFRREASSAAGLQHLHVVAVYDRGAWDDTYYIAMEYLEGRTLEEARPGGGAAGAGARDRPHDPDPARSRALPTSAGSSTATSSPTTSSSTGEGRVKVTDFGIAKAGASDMTQTGSIMGTAQYLSPEQAQGYSVSAPSDLYSVGIISVRDAHRPRPVRGRERRDDRAQAGQRAAGLAVEAQPAGAAGAGGGRATRAARRTRRGASAMRTSSSLRWSTPAKASCRRRPPPPACCRPPAR